MSENETIADIAAEIREAVECSSDGVIAIKGRYLADRIEAAAKREKAQNGNAAEMREALKPWIAFAEWLLENAGKDKLGEAIRENGPIIRQRMEELRAALSAPARNCDVGTPEEQAKRFGRYCDRFTRDRLHCEDCPCCGKVLYGRCEFAWAQMPYKAKESEVAKC